MKMSVYRQRTPMFEVEHGACLSGATTEEDVELVEMALATEKPVLIGLDGQTTIIKISKPGDYVFTFEALYDTSITLTDLRRTKASGVKTPDEIPLDNFQVKLAVTIGHAELDLQVMLAASNAGDVRKRLRDLMDSDAEFRERLFDKIAEALRQQDSDMRIAPRDVQSLGRRGENDPLWEFS